MNKFVTGCDKNTEWMLPWFLENYRRHNDIPIIFCDFGVSAKTLNWAKKNFDNVQPFSMLQRDINYFGPSWYLKPTALISTHPGPRVWIDTDCEILGDISGIFSYLDENKINIVKDIPWTTRRGEPWFNTGVVGVIDTPKVLFNWSMKCRLDSGGYTFGNVPRGDQDCLRDLIGDDPMKIWSNINELPNQYNWLRLQLLDGQDSANKLVVHWTGQKGKQEIMRKIQWKPVI